MTTERAGAPHIDERLPALDPWLVERLLDDPTTTSGVPAAYLPALDVLAAARGPVTAREQVGEAAAVAAFRARKAAGRGFGRRLPVKVAVAAVAALSVVGVAAAATGHLPVAGPGASSGVARTAAWEPAEVDQFARLGLCEAVARAADPAEAGPAADALARLAGGRDRIAGYCAGVEPGAAGSQAAGGSPAGPAPAAAIPGLCRAWVAGQPDAGGREQAVAFEALARVAGGADRIPAYCSGRAAGARPTDRPAGSSAPSGAGTTPNRPAPSAASTHPPRPTQAATPSRGRPTTLPWPAPTSVPGQGGRPSP